jgi:hypothetical protein
MQSVECGMRSGISFIAGGCERARVGIRAQVEADYAARLKATTPEEASRLRRDMQREIDVRVRQRAPTDALY